MPDTPLTLGEMLTQAVKARTQSLASAMAAAPIEAVATGAASGRDRMRRSRQRRKDGLRVIPFEIRESELDALVRAGLLAANQRNDGEVAASALGCFLDRVFQAG